MRNDRWGSVFQRGGRAVLSMVCATCLFYFGEAAAAPIALVPGSVNMFRETRAAANAAGFAQGDLLQYGADVRGGAAETTVGASYVSTPVFVDPQFPCTPFAVSPNTCVNTTPYNAARTAQPWTIRFERANEAPLTVSGPDLAGTAVPVPFPVDVTISGSGLTPTISWRVPDGFTPDAARIGIIDNDVVLPNGTADVIHRVAIPANERSYTIPEALTSGQQLKFGGDYVFNVQLIDTRRDPSFFYATNSNAEILRRSSSAFNFSPIPGGGTPNAYLPTVVDGVYSFRVTNVGPTFVTFIDPLVAVGYDYAIGPGNPRFASVLLPTGIGDNLFDLFLWNGVSFVDSGIELTGGSQFFFEAAGVERFSIRGIETSAGLDPSNVTAFITGLTFVSEGAFTGTMTPITVQVAVAEPGTAWLVSVAVAALVGWRRRRLAVAAHSSSPS